MWTTLAGPLFATMLTFKYGAIFTAYYIIWIGFTRWIASLLLLSARPQISWRYPFLLYYNQVYGAFLKTWILFRLDVQSWTRQKIKLMHQSKAIYFWNTWSSHVMHFSTIVLFICTVGYVSHVFRMPYAALRTVAPAHFSSIAQ
jgi:glycosyltransferase Alg8